MKYESIIKNLSFSLVHKVFLLLIICLETSNANNQIKIVFENSKINPSDLAIVYLENNSASKSIAEYYQSKRNIPDKNIFGIQLDGNKNTISADKFISVKEKLDKRVPKHIQAFALAWTQPYRVDCMSMTSAFSFGYSEQYCAQGCKTTKPNPYFNSQSSHPYDDHKVRPSMMLAAQDFNAAKALIDRGVFADNTNPKVNAYLLNTNDRHRSVRFPFYAEVKKRFQTKYNIQVLNQNSIKNKQNILFYFTGLPFVPDIDTLNYLPGAIADHLTSAGGVLIDSTQMSAMKWLEAGATGSYGTAIEPCNFPHKFPNPVITITNYTRGSTLLEAYWKSVLMPGQGNFIGEPLAAPFAGYNLTTKDTHIEVDSAAIYKGRYRIMSNSNEETIEKIQSIASDEDRLMIFPPYQEEYFIIRLN